MKALNCSNVSKTYPHDTFTLNIDSFEINMGDTVALLGPNGSGKTTLIKLILDLASQNSGQVTILGKDKKDKLSRAKVAFLPEQFLFPQQFSVWQVLFYYATINRTDYQEIKNQIKKIASELNVDFLHQKIESLSKGMKQTAALMNTFLEPQKFYILDEPFNGLDAVQKENVLRFLQALKDKRNITILVTTHVISDIEEIYDQVSLIKSGAIISQRRKKEVKKEFSSLKEYYLTHFQNQKLTV